MHSEIDKYNKSQTPQHREICEVLAQKIDKGLPKAENKVWHKHPVWFLDGNPIVGYSYLKGKDCIRLMFWSGADFNEEALEPGTGKFKDASAHFKSVSEIDIAELQRWLKKSQRIQWDYKNLVKRKGELVRVK